MATATQSSWHVFSRVCAGIFGSYAFTWGFIALGASSLIAAGTEFHEASSLASMLGFLIYLAAFCWAFIAASLVRVWVVLAGGGALMTAGGLVDLPRRLTMFANFRLSFAWLHTWFGLVLGFVLMVAFFFGSLSVFDREIDRWALPETRIEAAADAVVRHDPGVRASPTITEPEPENCEAASKRVTQPLPDKLTPANWGAYTTHRDPVLGMYVGFDVPNSTLPDDHVHGEHHHRSARWACVARDQLALGSAFFYPMHYSLHITWYDIGYWIVGAGRHGDAGGAGQRRRDAPEDLPRVLHVPAGKKLLRSTLDLHNLTGVVALPFHFLWALSGLIIFAGIYFPVLDKMMQPLVEAHEREEAQHTGLDTHPSGKPGTLASVDAMMAAAKERWASRGMPGEVGFLFVNHVGNSNAYVSIYRDSTDRVATAEGLHFEGSTGRVLFEDPPTGPVETVNAFLTGMHLQQFKHWTLRWLIFVGGLLSCVCIATGFIFFVEKRKQPCTPRGLRRFALGGCAGRDHRDRHGRRDAVRARDEPPAAGRPGAS